MTSILDAPTPSPILAGPTPAPAAVKPNFGMGEGLLSVSDIPGTRKAIYNRVLGAAQSIAPMTDGRRELRLEEVHYRPEDPEDYSPREHKRAILENRTLGRRLRGTWVLSDTASGQELDRKKVTLATVPWLSGDGAFVSNGTDTSVSHQMRLRPGVFARVKQTGEIESHANIIPGKGPSHRYRLDPATGKFVLEVHQAQLPLMPLLRAAGLNDKELEEAWGKHGKELVRIQHETDTPNNLSRVYKAVAGRKALANFSQLSRPEQQKALADLLPQWEIEPGISRKTLGAPFNTINKDALKAITSKLVRIANEEEDIDDRDQLAFQQILGPDDLFAERIARDYGRAQRGIFREAARRGSLKQVGANALQKQLNSVFTKSGLANSLEEANPSEILDRAYRISRMGEGGLPSVDAIPQESRMVSPSHYGFIDPSRTTECYSADMEVMTYRGWIPWPDVLKTDRFACMVSDKLVYRQASKLHSSDYIGPMYGAETARIAYLVTPLHRMWVRPADIGCLGYRFEYAEDMHSAHRKLMCGGHRPYRGKDHDLKFFEVPQCNAGSNSQREVPPLPINDWYEFLGWYLAEGSTVYVPEDPAYRVDISQSQEANPDNYERIKALLARLFPKYSCDAKGFSISGKQLAAYCRQFGGSADRHIPACAFEAPIAARRRMLESLLMGDGRREPRRNNKRVCYSSGSAQMADDVQCLLFGLGVSSKISHGKDKRKESYLPRHEVNIHEKQERTVGYQCGKLSVENYNGKVYCATVPGGLLYVRRKGKTGFWSGNSLRVGVDLYLAGKLRRDENGNIYAPVKNLQTGQTEWKTPQEISDLPLGFDEKSDRKHIPAIVAGKLQYARRNDVRYRVPHFEDAFSPLAQLIPMKSGTAPQRVAMGSRMCLGGGTSLTVMRGACVWRGPIVSYEFRDGDQLLSIDKSTKQQRWLPVVGLSKLPAKKPMCRITLSGGTVIDTTVDHRFVTLDDRGELLEIEAARLATGTPIPRAGRISLPSRKYLWKVAAGNKHNAHMSATMVADYRLGWLHGLYASEGNVNTYRRHDRVMGATLANLNPDVVAYALSACAYHSIPATARCGRDDGQIDRVVINWKQFALKLEEDFGDGSYNKRLPTWVYTAPKSYRQGLIAGYLAGDGTVAAHRDAVRVLGSSRSRQLRDDLSELLLTFGIATTKAESLVDTGPGGTAVTQFRFHVRSDCQHLLPKLHHPGKDRLLAERPWSGRRSADRVPMYAEMKRQLIDGTARRDRNRWRTYVDRHTRNSMIEVLGVDGTTTAHAWLRSVVRWESVVSIAPIETPEFVYDIDMGDNVFACAGGVFVHNCTQAVALTNPEAPLVRSATGDDPTRSYEEQYGSVMGAVRADRGGQVLLMAPDNIRVRYDDGEVKDIGLDNYRPLNRKSFRHQTALVQEGQRFAPGDMLAKSNYTDDKGTMAIGANFLTAYMPFRGLNHEDALVVSRSAAKRLQSEHAYQHTMDRTDDLKFDRKAFQSVFPNRFPQAILDRLDDDGVIKPGQTIEYGEPLVTALSQSQGGPTKLLRGKRPVSRDASVLWEHHAPGVVTDVAKTQDGINVVVKSLNEMETGDKLAPRYGDKGVVHIVEDDEMPRTKDGKPIEVIVSDLGVLSRANPAQVAEALLGKVARMTGKPINVPDFKDIDDLVDWAEKIARQHGLSPQEDLYDPVDDKKIPQVLTGERFFMKLHHMSESKGQGRGTGSYSNEERPSKGGETGCFIAEQKIATIVGDMPIKQICEHRLPVQVLTFDRENEEWTFRPVTNWFKYTALKRDLLHIVAESSEARISHLRVTRGHRLPRQVTGSADPAKADWVWTTCGELPVGSYDLVTPSLHGHRTLSTVSSVEPLYDAHERDKYIDVYDIEVAGTHTYVADGILVSNSKTIGLLQSNAIMSHGVTGLLRDVATVRGQANPDYWMAIRQGIAPPKPRIPFTYEKFVNELKSGGINVQGDGAQLNVMGLTDKDIESLAGKREIQRNDLVRLDDKLAPVRGGLFDESLTGGHGGNLWSRITLPEPLPNPVMQEPIRRMLGLTNEKFRQVLAGREAIPSGTGPKAIFDALDKIDVPKEIERVRKVLATGRKSDRDLAERQLGYLKGSLKTKQHPREWMLHSIPVLPPKFRPIGLMQHNDQPLVSDVNYLYREAIDARDNLKDMLKEVDDVGDERLGLYDSFQAITGLTDPQHPKLVEKQVSGVLQRVFGKGSAKYGTVQRKLLSRQVDLVGRAVVVPNPDLDMDSVGLPEHRAWPLYSEFVARRLRRRGFPLVRAMQEVENKTPLARDELLKEMDFRPVFVDRAPVLHRFGTLAFYPRLVPGNSMHISPAVLTGYAMDFDGDTGQYHVPASDDAIPEILDRMLPSRNLLSPADFHTPVPVSGKEFIGGLFTATKPARAGAKTVRYLNRKAALAAALRGDMPLDTPIEVD